MDNLSLNNTVERYLHPIPEQSWESLKEWIHEVRASKPIPSKWDEEEFKLWMMHLWISCWQDVLSFLKRKNLEDNIFSLGAGKWWDKNGLCDFAERVINE